MRNISKTLILSTLLTTSTLLAQELPPLNPEILPEQYVKPLESKEETKLDVKKMKEAQDKVFDMWSKNPLKCYTDIAGAIFPKCMEKDNATMAKCQFETTNKINEICTAPTVISIANNYKEKTGIEVDIKVKPEKLTPEFKEFLEKEFNQYKQQMFFFVGYKAGYYFSRKDYKKAKKQQQILLYEAEQAKKNENSK